MAIGLDEQSQPIQLFYPFPLSLRRRRPTASTHNCRLSQRPKAGCVRIVCAGQSDRWMQFYAGYGDYQFIVGKEDCAVTAATLGVSWTALHRPIATLDPMRCICHHRLAQRELRHPAAIAAGFRHGKRCRAFTKTL